MTKLISQTLAVLFIITAGVFSVSAQSGEKVVPMSETERSVRAFFDAYADDLRAHRREAIANRYDRRGAYFMGNGSKRLTTFDELRDRYMTKWTGPKAFEWKDLSVDVLSKNVVSVLARFEYTTVAGRVFNFSYTGILVKQDGKWRIRVEDESVAPPKPEGN